MDRGRLGWRRLAAGLLDWTLALVVPFAAVGAFAPDQSVTVTAAAVLAYFTLFRAAGATPGLRLVGLRTRSVATGARPGPLRSLLRATAGLVPAAAGVLLVSFGFGDPPAAGYSASALALAAGLGAVLAAALLGNLWLVVDGEGRTAQDRLFRLVTVRAP